MEDLENESNCLEWGARKERERRLEMHGQMGKWDGLGVFKWWANEIWSQCGLKGELWLMGQD